MLDYTLVETCRLKLRREMSRIKDYFGYVIQNGVSWESTRVKATGYWVGRIQLLPLRNDIFYGMHRRILRRWVYGRTYPERYQ